MSQSTNQASKQTKNQARSQPKPPPASQAGNATKPAPPPFFTAVVRADICAIVAAGCPFRTAAMYVGCKVAAIAALARHDREFARQLDKAVAHREVILLSYIREASKNSWRAAAWLLEYTVGGRYGGHIPTLDDEVKAEEAEELALLIGNNHRRDEEFADLMPQASTPNAGTGTQHSGFGIPDAARAENPAFEFDIPGFGKLVRDHAAGSDKQSQAAATRVTPASSPSATTTSPSALSSAAVMSESISEQQIAESMKALDELWTARKRDATVSTAQQRMK
jgi:hypothetical protein